MARRRSRDADAAAPTRAVRAEDALPGIGTLVEVGLAEGRLRRRTRVDHQEGTRLWVVAPLRPAGEVWPLEVEDPVAVTWATDRGVRTAHGRFVAEEGSAGTDVVLWIVEVARIEQTQRRQAYRLDISLPCTVTIGGRTVEAQTLDLSETGLRSRVSRGVGSVALGTDVQIELDLEEDRLVAAARVMRVDEPREAERRAEAVDLGLRFRDLDLDQIEHLRRFVLAEQLRRRRSGAE